MKIIFVGPRFEHPRTGGEFHISTVLHYLSAAGVEIQLLEQPHEGTFNNFLCNNVRDFYRLTRVSGLEGKVLVGPYSRRFHLVLFNWLVRSTMDVRIVGLVHAFYFSHRQSALKNTVDRFVSRLFLSALDMIIAGGQAAAEELSAMGVASKKIRVVYPALRRQFRNNRSRIATKWKANGRTVMLFVGRVNRIKGLECLLDALQILRDYHTVSLVVVGDRSRDPLYAHAVADRIQRAGMESIVEFRGRVEEVERLIDIYRSAHIFLLPSLWETSPVSLLEAMCFGLPIVASDVGGIPEYLG
ncbi:MAG: glycosyltransferase family 4 protein, partial [Anaerolineae bacterium]